MDSTTARGSTLQKSATLRRMSWLRLLFGAQDEDVGLEPVLQHHLHRVLRRFGLEFTRSGHVGYERQVHHGRVPQAEFVSQAGVPPRYREATRCRLPYRPPR